MRGASDGRPRTFAETTDLTIKNVIRPAPGHTTPITIDLRQLGPEGTTVMVGEATRGLRLVRTADKQVAVFDRVCDHEGACLDEAAISRGSLICPWHAKRIKPIGTIQLEEGPQYVELGPGCHLVAEGDRLTVVGLA